MWAMLAAPLLAGNDLPNMKPEIKAILTNRDVIAIDQDQLGKQGARIYSDGEVEVWTRHLSGGALAVAVLNAGDRPLLDASLPPEPGEAGTARPAEGQGPVDGQADHADRAHADRVGQPRHSAGADRRAEVTESPLGPELLHRRKISVPHPRVRRGGFLSQGWESTIPQRLSSPILSAKYAERMGHPGSRGELSCASLRSPQTDGKPPPRIGPGRLRRESGIGQHRLRLARRVFVAVLCVDSLAGTERHVEIECGKLHALRHQAFKVHFDAGLGAVPDGAVREGF